MSDRLIRYYESECERRKENLIHRLEALIEDAQLEIRKMREFNRIPDGYGILRNRAGEIDVLCARYAEMAEIVETIKAERLAADASGEES